MASYTDVYLSCLAAGISGICANPNNKDASAQSVAYAASEMAKYATEQAAANVSLSSAISWTLDDKANVHTTPQSSTPARTPTTVKDPASGGSIPLEVNVRGR